MGDIISAGVSAADVAATAANNANAIKAGVNIQKGVNETNVKLQHMANRTSMSMQKKGMEFFLGNLNTMKSDFAKDGLPEFMADVAMFSGGGQSSLKQFVNFGPTTSQYVNPTSVTSPQHITQTRPVYKQNNAQRDSNTGNQGNAVSEAEGGLEEEGGAAAIAAI